MPCWLGGQHGVIALAAREPVATSTPCARYTHGDGCEVPVENVYDRVSNRLADGHVAGEEFVKGEGGRRGAGKSCGMLVYQSHTGYVKTSNDGSGVPTSSSVTRCQSIPFPSGRGFISLPPTQLSS
jgi:hypothetical protein